MRLIRKADMAAILIGFGVLAGAALPALADTQTREARITVSGEGSASVKPDMAVVTLSVMRQAETARAALDENNKAMAAVLDAMKKEGIAERDLQTSGFGIAPQYVYPTSNDAPQAPKIVGYQATNSLTVRLRDLGKLGALLDQAVTLGVNQGGDINFTNDKPDEALNEARREAVADAMAKAKLLADAAGVKLGRVIEISESGGRPMPIPMVRMSMAKEAADSAVPIAQGETSYMANVSIVFALDQ